MVRKILLIFLVMVLLAGCDVWEDPYRVDTVIYIPVDPTEDPTEETAAPQDPTEESEMPTEATEEAAKPQSGSTKRPSSGKGSSGKSSSAKATEPPETQPPATEPPATEPENTLYDISGYSVGHLERAIAEQINECRTAEGLSPLAFDNYLCAIASARSYEAAGYWSHTRPDGRSYATVLSDYGYGASTVEELLVHGNFDAVAIVEMWMASDNHEESLLGTAYTTVGIGVYSRDGVTVITCLLVG